MNQGTTEAIGFPEVSAEDVLTAVLRKGATKKRHAARITLTGKLSYSMSRGPMRFHLRVSFEPVPDPL